MQWNRILMTATIIASLIIAMAAFPEQTQAEPNNPGHLFMLNNAKIYNTRNLKSKPAGALKANQMVTVVETDRNSQTSEPVQWYLVKTWIGNKWIKADTTILLKPGTYMKAFTMLTGTYKKENYTVTSVYDLNLYDHPVGMRPATPHEIEPQKLHVTATFILDPVNWDTVSDWERQNGIWYQVDSEYGKKWIVDPDLLQNVEPTPVSYAAKLTGTETAYEHPFPVEPSPDIVEPQVVQVVGEWTTGYRMDQKTWLKIRLPQGDRWIDPHHAVIKNYRELNEPITLPTDTRYFDAPTEYFGYLSAHSWLKPGTYDAFEATGGWVHIRTENGEVWVNPKRALQERPEGIVPIDQQIKLAKDSRYYQYPLTKEESHAKGFYAPQTVKAFEKWTAKDGSVLYRFHGVGGEEWVLLK